MALAAALLLVSHADAAAQLRPEEVAVLANRQLGFSEVFARRYLSLRQIPEGNLLVLPLGKDRSVPRKFYEQRMAGPVASWLRDRPGIKALVTISGVPYLIQPVKDRADSSGSVDNELAAALQPPPDSAGFVPNPLFLRGQNTAAERNPRAKNMVFVARLDGPGKELMERLVQDALAVEKEGLAGGVFVDSKGLPGAVAYGSGDVLMRAGLDRLAGAGFPAALDEADPTWEPGPTGRSAVAEGAAFYGGWYKLRQFQDIFGERGLARGALAFHLASAEAVDIWSAQEKGWAVNLLRRGAAATWGPVREPYVTAFPHEDLLLEKLLEGASLVEAYWLSLPHVSWAMVLIGDPLYRPFAVPRPSILASSYRVPGAGGLAAGRSQPLAVSLRCVGPPGSRTPALKGTARAGRATVSAQAELELAPLEAGRSTRVLLPAVEVKGEAGQPFRVYLDLDDQQGGRRQVGVEGRVGLARLLSRPSQVFLAEPQGKLVVSGLASAPVLIRADDLEQTPLPIPAGSELAAGQFSPDAARLAMSLRFPRGAGDRGFVTRTILRDLSDGDDLPLPDSITFLEWISADTILVVHPDSVPGAKMLARLNVSSGAIQRVDAPPGSRVRVAGPEAVLVEEPGGEISIRKAGQPALGVLLGKGPFLSSAAAQDLTVFSGLAKDHKIWTQHGPDEAPIAVGESAGPKMWWGGLSRRFAFMGKDGRGRVYDPASRKTFELQPIQQGWWSPDESKFLYQTGERDQWRLMLWTSEASRPVLRLDRVGVIVAGSIPSDGKRFLFLASAEQVTDVWELRLES